MLLSTLVVGVGNRFRRDDGAGLQAVERLRRLLPDDIRLAACEGNVAGFLDGEQDVERVVVIDATSSGRPPGTIRTFHVHERALPAAFSRSSTHAFGVAEALELARALGRLPPRVIVYGIEGEDFTPGEGLSPRVETAVAEVVGRVHVFLLTPDS